MEITWELVLAIAGGLVVITNAVKAIAPIISPFKNMSEKLKKHDELLANDNIRLEINEKTSNLMCKSMMALLEHEITGNSVDKLKMVKKELQDFLIEKR